MTEKVKVITPESGLPLSALDVRSGDLVGLDDGYIATPPFVLIRAESGVQRLPDSQKSRKIKAKVSGNLILESYTNPLTNPELEGRYVIPSKIHPLGLHSPTTNDLGLRQPNTREYSYGLSYTVISAFVGEEEIIRALREKGDGLDFYANWLEGELARSEILVEIVIRRKIGEIFLILRE
jgi:hypothetical protein